VLFPSWPNRWRIAGQATLHRGVATTARGRVRIFVCREFRGRGVGTALIQGIVDVAKLAGLHHIFTLSVSSKTQDMRAFEDWAFVWKGHCATGSWMPRVTPTI